ncbi:MAG TPA: methyltransferase [Beijerinckiaceae bacterium]|nr:methyltransferase [Beijerinckiaceae bacterium]
MNDAPEPVTHDMLLDGRVRIVQPRRGHRAGTDAVLLAAAVDPHGDETVVDVGAGTGAVGLMIAARARGAGIVLVERDPELAAQCRHNVRLNGFEARARVVEADILASAGERRRNGLASESASIVVTNPPFLDAGRSRASPDARRAAAHQLPENGLEQWLRACGDLLKPKGVLALIHRGDQLAECLRHLQRGFGGVVVKAIHPRAGEPAVRIVISARKGSRAPLLIAPPLVLHEGDGRFTADADAIHRGEKLLASDFAST